MLFRCQFRETGRILYDNSDPDVIKNRQPMAVYCKYDVSHVFTSIDECEEHMQSCNRREEHERKAEQCHRKFTHNKAWIKAAQAAKKQKEQEMEERGLDVLLQSVYFSQSYLLPLSWRSLIYQ